MVWSVDYSLLLQTHLRYCSSTLLFFLLLPWIFANKLSGKTPILLSVEKTWSLFTYLLACIIRCLCNLFANSIFGWNSILRHSFRSRSARSLPVNCLRYPMGKRRRKSKQPSWSWKILPSNWGRDASTPVYDTYSARCFSSFSFHLELFRRCGWISQSWASRWVPILECRSAAVFTSWRILTGE